MFAVTVSHFNSFTKILLLAGRLIYGFAAGIPPLQNDAYYRKQAMGRFALSTEVRTLSRRPVERTRCGLHSTLRFFALF